MAQRKQRFVVVTTANDRRGVFGGFLAEHDTASGTATLTDFHMCVYWSSATRGVCGLAAKGPQDGSKITPVAPRIELNGVTAVMDATKDAMKAWQKEPWG